jgi:hypothetical protein
MPQVETPKCGIFGTVLLLSAQSSLAVGAHFAPSSDPLCIRSLEPGTIDGVPVARSVLNRKKR